MPNFHEFGELHASCDHMPGKPLTLRVGGDVKTRTGGFSAGLEPRQTPGPINPLMLQLDLVLTHSGGPSADAITQVDLEEYVEVDPAIEYTEVEINVSSEDGGGSKVVEVVHTQ